MIFKKKPNKEEEKKLLKQAKTCIKDIEKSHEKTGTCPYTITVSFGLFKSLVESLEREMK